jgi:hypothetical protein
MAQISLAADSTTLVINGFAINDLAEGDTITITPVNPKTSHVNSANGGVNINSRVDGDVVDLVVRVQALSQSDAYLNGLVRTDVPSVINGSCKEVYLRDIVEGVESWTLRSGSFTTLPTRTFNNQDGNSLIEYTVRFRQGIRNI